MAKSEKVLTGELVGKLTEEFKIEKEKKPRINKYNASTQTYYSDEEAALRNVPQQTPEEIARMEQSSAPQGELGDLLEEFLIRKNGAKPQEKTIKKGYASIEIMKNDKWHS